MTDRKAILFIGMGGAIGGAIGKKHGARALAEEHPRRTHNHQRRDRHRVQPPPFPERCAAKDAQGIVDPEGIAEAYCQLHLQLRDA